jgi:hypothetical protein
MWQLFCFEHALILLYRVKVQIKEALFMITLRVLKIPKYWANWITTSNLRKSHKKCLKPGNLCWMSASLQHLYVLKMKYDVIILSELLVATFCRLICCISIAHSADSAMWSRMAVGDEKRQLSHKISTLNNTVAGLTGSYCLTSAAKITSTTSVSTI